jgi:hypothetical protein
MEGNCKLRRYLRISLVGIGMLAGAGLTGCQVDQGGQTLPSPYYFNDDVQYYAPATQFKLAREAAAMKEFSQQQTGQAAPAPAAPPAPPTAQAPPVPQPPIP